MYSGPSFPATISIAFFASTFLLPFYKFFFFFFFLGRR